jgi:shikimate dehydrogenase
MGIKIDGETRVFGLLGSKISYTKSPAMHNRAAQILGINAVYLPFNLEADTLSRFLDAAFAMNFDGFNITQPHKELAAQLFGGDRYTSVNTLYRSAAGWSAASTDGEGFDRGLSRLGRELSSFAEVVFIGAGGAVSAVLEYMARTMKQLPKVTVLRRTDARDELLRQVYGGRLEFMSLGVDELRNCVGGRKQETLLVQASSAPLKGDDLSELIPAIADFGGKFVDMVYSTPSKLYFAALNADLDAIGGEPMLIEQARAAQKLWWGKSASYEEMLLALRGK